MQCLERLRWIPTVPVNLSPMAQNQHHASVYYLWKNVTILCRTGGWTNMGMRGEGFLFSFGGQPSATVPDDFAMAVPRASGECAKVVILGGFKRHVASFRVVALCDILSCFKTRNVSKVVLCDRCNTFASFSEEDFHFAWQAQHCRCVVLCVFAKRIVGAASSGDNLQIVLQAWNRESFLLRGRRSIRCRSVVCGMSFCVAGAVFGTLHTPHSSHSSISSHSSLSSLYT